MKTAAFIEEQKAAKINADKPEKRHTRGNASQFRGPSPDVGKATQFKPGICPNPGGRPKKDWSADIARAVFENNAEAIYKAMLKPLLAGNAYAFKELAERAYGKLKERHELTGADGGALMFKDVSDAELDASLKEHYRQLDFGGIFQGMSDADIQARRDEIHRELELRGAVAEIGGTEGTESGADQASVNE